MKVVIRADASVAIGTGHVMRCLTLASRLRKAGAAVSFVCRELSGNMAAFIEDKGFIVHRLHGVERLPEASGIYEKWLGVGLQRDADDTLEILKKELGVDWLVIDHYGIDKSWEERMRPFVKKVMVIDDLTNRPHDCDLLLNQSILENNAGRYDGLIPDGCKRLVGPQYSLLRPEFIEARERMRQRDGQIRRIFVFFGGSDISNETMKALLAIKSLNLPDVSVDVVAGGANAHLKEIEGFCSAMTNTRFYGQTDNMAGLMSLADLALGASGTTTWERCCLGLPSLVVAIADNQVEIAANLDKMGVVVNLGPSREVTEEGIRRRLADLIGKPELVKAISVKTAGLTDGSGVEVVVKELYAEYP